MYDKPVNAKPTKAAQTIFEMNKLSVSQKTGQVRDGSGKVVGRRRWLVDVDYSIDASNRELVVNAASAEEAEEKAEEILKREALRNKMELGHMFVNLAMPEEEL